MLARGEVGLAAAAAEVTVAGATPMVVPVDVADPFQIEAAVARIENELGPIDIWVNSAFTSIFARFAEISPAEFKRVTEVTYLGAVYATMAVLRRMRERDAGTIVQVGSTLAYRGIPLQTAYCGAKHALQGFHESLRCELLHDQSHVQVTMVQLPAVNTPQFSWVLSRLPARAQPVPPIYQPEVAARAVLYAADHPNRREYWVGASTAATLIMNAVVPGLLDRYLARTGFKAQQTGRPMDPDQPANLWEPADGTGATTLAPMVGSTKGPSLGAPRSFYLSTTRPCWAPRQRQVQVSPQRSAGTLGDRDQQVVSGGRHLQRRRVLVPRL